MVELARIEAHLESLGQLGELVGALRSMAASRAREAQEALVGTRAYCDIIDRAVAGLGSDHPEKTPHDRVERRALLVITSENGFVGGFNTRLMDAALRARAAGDTLAIIGRRGQILAAERHIGADVTFAMTSRAAGITQLSRRIAARLTDFSHVRILFAASRPGAAFDLRTVQALPLPQREPDDTGYPPLTHVGPATLRDRFASEHLFAAIADALMEGLASENGARLHTMNAASRNIDDRLERLRREERAARQEQTTSDMLEVIVGSEAVNHA
jgi:F-type H+-transporting ATPase subunit gamma